MAFFWNIICKEPEFRNGSSTQWQLSGAVLSFWIVFPQALYLYNSSQIFQLLCWEWLVCFFCKCVLSSSSLSPLCSSHLLVFAPFPGGGYHGYDESYGSPPYEGRRMGPPMRGRGGSRYGPGYGPPPPPPGEYGAHADSPVVMVYGLDPIKMNADRVFNIFCLYGNVERVSVWCWVMPVWMCGCV